jgi:hypothetical protein
MQHDFGDGKGHVNGWNAALRSLGAGTPEAQQALRRFVAAALNEQRAREDRKRCLDDDGGEQASADMSYSEAYREYVRAKAAFAALATPPEED